jgi:hypothetical protein
MGTRTTDQTVEKINCQTCGDVYSVDCDYQQGRCPHHPPLIDLPIAQTLLLLLAAPFVIAAWTIINPKKAWQQVKKDWNSK